MPNPGDLIPYGDDALVRVQADLERKHREDMAARSLAASTIGAGGLIVKDGGSITIQGTGSFNTNGVINTTGSFSAGTTISAGGNVTSGGTVQGAALRSTGNSQIDGSENVNGNITASGQVTSAAPLKSPGSYALVVSGNNYRTAWIQSDGQVGYSPSTIRVKKDLEEFPDYLLDAFLACSPYLGRYTWDDEDSPLKVFLIAEHLAHAGFGTDVVPQDDEGNAEAVNYSQVVVPLFAAVKRQQSQIESLTERLDAAGL